MSTTAVRSRGCWLGSVSSRSLSEPETVVLAVTVIMGVVVALTFLFGFGNVLSLDLRLGVPGWVAPLVAPAVDLSVIGLLLAINCVPPGHRSARRLLIFASLVTLALNVAEPLIVGHLGKAAFDAVGPLLLIGWAEVGPGLLAALAAGTKLGTAGHGDQHHLVGASPGGDGRVAADIDSDVDQLNPARSG